ncbi:proton-conducting transporter transmembrane domain-containing protein [Archangium lipolyticum]|uniref:proton-conducting transporter transmembrane domain-containing protein n=1 Tax=Archangium lipolyticum TaxID=2970465 RepID=UPI002149EAA9|nr:proton-conducting transporter membrane subunit [Archangium lipolyticum]
MVDTYLNLQGHGAGLPVAVPIRTPNWWSLSVGLIATVGVWVSPTRPLFVASWVLLFAWACVRAGMGGRERATRLPVLPLLAGLLTTGLALWGTPSQPLAALGAAVAGGVMPFHLWLESLRRRLGYQEFLLLLLCQPGVVWLHRFVEGNPTVLHGGLGNVLLVLFVVSALLQSGLGLVRREPARAITAITLSQSCLLMAGAFSGHVGWQAARTLLVATVAGTLVLLSVIGMLRDTYGIERLAPDNGLADVASDLHRLFLAMGWLFVGLPGGLAFFAEDLLFHALLERSTAATLGFLLASGLNAIVFYRVYLGLFCGNTRLELREALPPRTASRRRRVVLLTVVTALVLLGGLAPALFV